MDLPPDSLFLLSIYTSHLAHRDLRLLSHRSIVKKLGIVRDEQRGYRPRPDEEKKTTRSERPIGQRLDSRIFWSFDTTVR
jgi:hypothetical protein